uniref:Putative ovule protein n=1 Tax=Solanum chacoense TaxID=4108 RepID=A0A0V0GNA6_SOLCH
MGLHLLIILKLNLRASSLSLNTPLIISLLCPFIIRLAACSFKPLHQIHYNLVHSMRLFLFQMSQITFNSQPPAPTRWERAVRLVYERFTRARHTQFREMDEESLRALSMIAL